MIEDILARIAASQEHRNAFADAVLHHLGASMHSAMATNADFRSSVRAAINAALTDIARKGPLT